MQFSLTGLAESSGVFWSTCTSEVLAVHVVGTRCTVKTGLTSAVIKSSRGWGTGWSCGSLKRKSAFMHVKSINITL